MKATFKGKPDHLGELRIFVAFLFSVSQEKSKGSKYLPSKQQDSNASKPLIGNQPNRPQPHKQQSKNPKGRPDDVFTRLQRIYGNAEEVKQGVQRGTALPAKNVSRCCCYMECV